MPNFWLEFHIPRNYSGFVDELHQDLGRDKSILSSWKSKNISIGGKIMLSKVVFDDLLVCYLSLYRAPVKVVDDIERLRRDFC